MILSGWGHIKLSKNPDIKPNYISRVVHFALFNPYFYKNSDRSSITLWFGTCSKRKLLQNSPYSFQFGRCHGDIVGLLWFSWPQSVLRVKNHSRSGSSCWIVSVCLFWQPHLTLLYCGLRTMAFSGIQNNSFYLFLLCGDWFNEKD